MAHCVVVVLSSIKTVQLAWMKKSQNQNDNNSIGLL